MRTYKITLIALLCSLAWASAPAPAEAAPTNSCNGSPVIWRDPVTLHRNRCSIADTGNVNTAYWNGVNKWNQVFEVVTSFKVNAATDCTISHGDDENEVALVNRATIDGNNGLTVLQLGLCVFGSNNIDEADVMIANDLGFTPVWGNFLGTTGRSTFVHELGHFYGFLHHNVHSIMRTSPPHLVTGDNEPSTNWPSDTAGMNAVYGFSPSRRNLIVSALGVVSGSVQTLDPAVTVATCRGGSRTTRVYLGNTGNLATGTFSGRIRLSTTAPFAGYSGSTTVVSTFTQSLSAFSEKTLDFTFTVPSSLPYGTYFLYVDLDPSGSIVEAVENDNSTVSAMKIQVNCG